MFDKYQNLCHVKMVVNKCFVNGNINKCVYFLDNGPLKVSLYDIHMLMNQNLLDGFK